jgi:hypothetical protein
MTSNLIWQREKGEVNVPENTRIPLGINNMNVLSTPASDTNAGQGGPSSRIPPSMLKSREECVEFLKSQLNGQSVNTTGRGARLQRRMQTEPAGALLYGVALHAAARHAKGLELSPLEDRVS